MTRGQARAASDAKPASSPDRGPERWQEALTRRLRTLVRTTALHRLESNKGHLAARVSEQDLRALALRVLDVCIEEMGLGYGAEREDVLSAVGEMVQRIDSELDGDAARGLAQHVLDGLLNERERRIAFEERYLDWEGPEPVARTLQYHLLHEEERPDGALCLRATTEGINLYTGMLDFEVQDAQVAAEAVLQAQLRRGRIDDAVRTARDARLRSIELQRQIERLVRLAQRDVSQLQWADEVIGLLSSALDHIGERIDVERELLAMVAERLASADEETGPKLAALSETLDDCMRRHLRLHRAVLESNRAFLDEQERQAFRPRALLPLPDLEKEVLGPALKLSAAALQPALASAWRAALRVQARPVLYLPQLVDRLLAPGRRKAETRHQPDTVELEPVLAMAPHFDAGHETEADELLQALGPEGRRLSSLLQEGRERGRSDRTLHLLVLRALRAFGPGVEGPGEALRAADAGLALDEVAFSGDDLTLFRNPAPAEQGETQDAPHG